jgi:hypothetical protein
MGTNRCGTHVGNHKSQNCRHYITKSHKNCDADPFCDFGEKFGLLLPIFALITLHTHVYSCVDEGLWKGKFEPTFFFSSVFLPSIGKCLAFEQTHFCSSMICEWQQWVGNGNFGAQVPLNTNIHHGTLECLSYVHILYPKSPHLHWSLPTAKSCLSSNSNANFSFSNSMITYHICSLSLRLRAGLM